MAAWIKFEHTTPDKPEVVTMAEILGIDQDAVVGKCLRIWIWADQQSIDGNALSVTESFLDRITGCAGFSKAMRSVGWLAGETGGLLLPNFIKHNGQTAKNRALTTNRVQKSRNAQCVTESLPDKIREDQIREDRKEEEKTVRASARFVPPTIDEVRSYCEGKGSMVDPEAWWNHYESKGWMIGKNKMVKWKAAIATWEKGNRNGQPGKYGTNRRESRAERLDRDATDFLRELRGPQGGNPPPDQQDVFECESGTPRA